MILTDPFTSFTFLEHLFLQDVKLFIISQEARGLLGHGIVIWRYPRKWTYFIEHLKVSFRDEEFKEPIIFVPATQNENKLFEA